MTPYFQVCIFVVWHASALYPACAMSVRNSCCLTSGMLKGILIFAFKNLIHDILFLWLYITMLK